MVSLLNKSLFIFNFLIVVEFIKYFQFINLEILATKQTIDQLASISIYKLWNIPSIDSQESKAVFYRLAFLVSYYLTIL